MSAGSPEVLDGESVDDAEFDSLDGSLAARMQARRAAIQKDSTRQFDLPHYNGILRVELRPMGMKAEERIAKQNRKAPTNLRDLYNTADLIVQATVGFYHYDPDTGRTRPVAGSQNDWQSIARSAYPDLGPVTTRQAFLRLMDLDDNDQPAAAFFREYREWLETRGQEVDEEMEADLGVTR